MKEHRKKVKKDDFGRWNDVGIYYADKISNLYKKNNPHNFKIWIYPEQGTWKR